MQDRQTDIFDFQKHEDKQKTFKDHLSSLNEIIKWETFLPILEAAFKKERKSEGGRKRFDLILMLKVIILQNQ